MRTISWLLGLGAICAASQQSISGPTSQPIRPTKDPWYTAPSGFEAAAPGTILRLRAAPGNLTTDVVKNASAAYNILYRTTDSRYKPSWAVTTIFIPMHFYVSPSGKKALLSYQVAYDSAALDSSPSYGLYYDYDLNSIALPSTTELITECLNNGWVVSVPDYEGPSAAFGASIQAGHATLDSVRAVLNLANIYGLGNFSVGIWGYSGGSIATEAAAELQVQYAPELNISGVVAGGVVADAPADITECNESFLAGDIVAILLGVTVQYPEANAYLRSRLHPENATEFLGALNMTTNEQLNFFFKKDIFSYFIGGMADIQAKVLQDVLNVELKLGYHGVPAMPVFVYKAIGDEICAVSETDALVDKFCGVGADITYHRNTVGGHVDEIRNGQPRVLDWLWKIFNESYVPNISGCSIRDVTVNITSTGL
ncbi:LIP-domain-containing protein [Hypoxylon sp. FL1857]|nr:LIP-domain-containing protein [Hypoxylon sp. FL1857]